eukprot:3874013-Prymnesium_polylepis.1
MKAALDAVKAGGPVAALMEVLIGLREATEVLGNSNDTKVRTVEEAARKKLENAAQRGTVHLEGDGEGDKALSPAAALRMLRKDEVEDYFAKKKQGRLARWMKGAAVAVQAGLEGDGATVQSGECWVVLLSATGIGLAIV